MNAPLTRAQLDTLWSADYNGAADYLDMRHVRGGSFLRHCRRLADLGLLEHDWPHRITNAGRVAIGTDDKGFKR